MINDLSKIIFDKLQDFRQNNGGKLESSNIDDIVKQISEIIKVHVTSEEDVKIFEEIEKIAEQIKSTKTEVQRIDKNKVPENFIPGATSELSSITELTEKSTEVILDKTEEIQNISNMIENPEIKEKIVNCTLTILEACNFQDVTGQRISKLITSLNEIETSINSIIKTFGNENDNQTSQNTKVSEDDKLLNGPQDQKSAPSQKDIDDIFNSL